MLAKRVTGSAAELERFASPLWSRASGELVTLTGVPIGLQPSPYIVASRQDRLPGRVQRLQVKALHDNSRIAFKLEWEDPHRDLEVSDTNRFPDGAGLLFPLKGDAPLISMGTEEQPVIAWHWRADRPDHARSNVARGLGTTRVTDEHAVTAEAGWQDGRWSLVFARALHVPGEAEAIQFSAGDTVKVAFAIWEGSNAERAGLKSFSPEWYSVALEA